VEYLSYDQQRGFAVVKEDVATSSWAWRDQEAEDDWRKRLGYEELWSIGDKASDCCAAYESVGDAANNAPARFMVSIWDSSHGDTVFVHDRASLMELRLKLSAHVLASTHYLLAELERTARLAFRAFHGHDNDSVCAECDPHENRHRQEQERARLAQKQEP
jgi:hypothetical protein